MHTFRLNEILGWTEAHWAEYDARTITIKLSFFNELTAAVIATVKGKYPDEDNRKEWEELETRATDILHREFHDIDVSDLKAAATDRIQRDRDRAAAADPDAQEREPCA